MDSFSVIEFVITYLSITMGSRVNTNTTILHVQSRLVMVAMPKIRMVVVVPTVHGIVIDTNIKDIHIGEVIGIDKRRTKIISG